MESRFLSRRCNTVLPPRETHKLSWMRWTWFIPVRLFSPSTTVYLNLSLDILPFFDQDATFGSNAWPSVEGSANWFRDRTSSSKKIIFTQTGWPTNINTWPPTNAAAQASYESSKAYLDLLDTHCEDFKHLHGGIGWFWQIWNDVMLDGWGALDWNNNPKFQFSPRTDC